MLVQHGGAAAGISARSGLLFRPQWRVRVHQKELRRALKTEHPQRPRILFLLFQALEIALRNP